MSYKNETANIIKKSLPELEKVGAGTLEAIVLEIPVTVAANATAVNFTVPYGFKLIDAFAVGSATSSGATLTLRTGTTALTSGMACAAADALGRATTLTVGTHKAGDVLNVIANGAADRGTVFLIGKRT